VDAALGLVDNPLAPGPAARHHVGDPDPTGAPVSVDRLPPQSLEAEQSVLGALLIDRDAIIEVADVLRPGDFYRQANGKIYGVMVDLWERREPIDIVTVAEALERVGELEAIGGRGYLSSLAEQTPTAVFASQYARIVERKAVLRNLIAAAGRIAGIGYEDSPEVQEAIDRAEAELYSVSERRLAAGFIPLKQLLHEAFDRLDDLHTHRGEISGVRTGFPDLDALTTGLQPSDLVILAARPSVGKTSLALNIAEHAAIGHAPARSVGIFSLEMSKEQLVLRLLSSVGGIDSQRLRTGFLDEMDFVGVSKAMTALSEAPIYIDDTPNISTMELRTKARRLQAEVGLDLVIVDYLQLMQSSTTTKDANRVQEVSEISRGLKALARELKVPVIALSQLSRQPEARTTPEPRLSDLRESGALEQDSDLVIFLWREKERASEEHDTDGEVVKLRLAKHRNGPTGEIELWFKKSQTRFVSYAGDRYAGAVP
jgi:replicative DNA helicase